MGGRNEVGKMNKKNYTEKWPISRPPRTKTGFKFTCLN